MSVHPRVKHAEVRELLPFIARHFIKQRVLTVYHFIVAEHENEMLLEGIEQRESNVAVVKAPINRIELHVLQEVVHPTHVPFEAEAEPAEIRRPRNAGPRG